MIHEYVFARQDRVTRISGLRLLLLAVWREKIFTDSSVVERDAAEVFFFHL